MQSEVRKCASSAGNREVVEYNAYLSPDCIRGYSQLTASRLLVALMLSGVRVKNPEGIECE